MSGLRLVLATAAWLVLGVGVTAEPDCQQDPALADRYHALIRQVRCPKCQNESIADSKAPVAQDLRRGICEQVLAGASDAEALDWVHARYGDFALYKPRSWVIWAAPLVLVAIGAVAFVRILRARAQQPIDEDDDA